MANFNKVILAGNTTRDPQVKFLNNERAVANFGMAINNRWKAADGTQKEDVTFVDCEAWGKTAELIGQYVTKGSPILIEGKLRLDTWEKEGVKHSKLKVVVDNVQFLGAGKMADASEDPNTPPARHSVAQRQVRRETAAISPPVEEVQPPF